MKKEKIKTVKIVKRIVLSLISVILALCVAATGICLLISRPALNTTEYYQTEYSELSINVEDDGSVQLTPKDGKLNNIGIIFYCGAQIEPSAYIPLLSRIAEKGYFISIPKLAFNMAALSHNIASETIEEHPETEKWYIGGHSMGGLTASGFADDNRNEISGLFLLGAYTNRDFSDCDMPILSIYGDCDTVLNKNLYNERLTMYSADFQEYIIGGGNHAEFGDYGAQPRDSEAQIEPEKQWDITADYILSWLNSYNT